MSRFYLDWEAVLQPLDCEAGVEWQTVILRLPGSSLLLYNIYRLPVASLDLDELFELAASEPLLVVGDFNPHHPMLDSANPSNETARCRLHAAYVDSGQVLLLTDTESHPCGHLDLAVASTRLKPPPE